MSDSHPINLDSAVGVSTGANPAATQLCFKKIFASLGSLVTGFLVGVCLNFLYIPFSIFGVPASLLLLISFLVTRILQLFTSGDVYETLALYKHYFRFWLLVTLSINLIGLGLFCVITNCIRGTLLDMLIVFTEMCSLFSLSTCIYILVAVPVEVFVMHGSSRNAGEAISEISDSLFFWRATNLLMKYVPSINHHEILRLPIRNWIWVSVVILISYNLLILFTCMIVWLLRKVIFKLLSHSDSERWDWLKNLFKNILHVKYVVYYANGMIASTCFVISSLVLLLTWIFYFGSHLDLKSANIRSFWECGRWTFIKLLLCSFLWLIKNLVLLVWEEHTVYDRLELQIKSTSQQLYFLGILGSLKHDFFRIQNNPGDDDKSFLSLKLKLFLQINKLFSHLKLLPPEVRKTVQNNLLIQSDKDTTLDDIQRAAQYFAVAKQHLSKEMYIPHVLNNFHPSGEILKKLILGEKVNLGTTETSRSHTEEEAVQNDQEQLEDTSSTGALEEQIDVQDEQLGWPVGETSGTGALEEQIDVQDEQQQDSSTSNDGGKWNSDWSVFNGKLQVIKKENPLFNKNQDNSNSEIGYSEFQTWVERAHNQCVNLANTLNSAKELADCLNKIMSSLIIVAISIMWLLVTGFATTEVLVFIASPLLAVSFIIGETCKTLFQGIIYVFVVHPFDVGDLCVIEDKMLEVRAIGVWTTTFTKVDKFGMGKELVVYSNTVLTSKVIINHKTKFDWSDCVEFNLGSVKKIDSGKKNEIIDFFMGYLNPDFEQEDNRLRSDEEQEIRLDLPVEEENGVEPDTEEHHFKKKKFPFLSKIPNVSVSAKEDSIMLVIRLDYEVEGTEEWTYSECFRKKDDLKGDFHLYVQDIIRIFKAKYGQPEINEIILRTEG